MERSLEGSSLLLIVSSEESRDNVMIFLKYSGAEMDKIDEQAGEFSIYTKEISALANPESQPEDHLCETSADGSGTVIFINKDRIGHGSDELGGNLIKAFIATMKDLSVQPRTICFMNSGVKLTVKEWKQSPHLKELEEKGVELLVCETCWVTLI